MMISSPNILKRFPTFSDRNRNSILVNRLSVKFIGCFTRLPPMMVLAVVIELPRVSPCKQIASNSPRNVSFIMDAYRRTSHPLSSPAGLYVIHAKACKMQKATQGGHFLKELVKSTSDFQMYISNRDHQQLYPMVSLHRSLCYTYLRR